MLMHRRRTGLIVPGGVLIGQAMKSGGSFNPASVAGAQFWIDPSTLTGLNDGDPIPSMPDLFGNGRDATQGTAAKRPTYQTNEQNGLAIFRTDGVDDDIRVTIDALTARTLFVVVKQAAVLNDKWAFGIGGLGAAGVVTVNAGADWAWQETQALGSQTFGGTPTDWSLITIKVNSAASIDAYVNGSAATNFDPHDQAVTQSVLILGQQGNTSRFIAADYGSVIGYDVALNDADRTYVRDGLMDQWAIV